MPPQNAPHMFSNARNPVIFGGTFNNVNSPDSKRYGFKLLLDNISRGAFHNAAERGEPPKCHPQTRTAIRNEIMEWIKAPNSMRKLILWIYGPAGSGKTAITQSIAEECERQGLLAASFFFSRTATGRNDSSLFIATLAYQLSRHIPLIEEYLFTAIEQDPTVFSRSLLTQMRVLVIEPLINAAPSLLTPIFVAVDGVDECGPDAQSQAEIVNILATAMSGLQHIPLIILLTSRPEYEIREAFYGNPLSSLVKRLVLDDSYKPDQDIKIYFDSTFDEVHQKHFRLGSSLPSPWPAEKDVNILVSKASGQFIFAATVMRFVDSPRENPSDRLNIILGLSCSGNETPFALLDALYRFILGSVADIQKVLEILALLLLADDYSSDLSVDLVEELLRIDVHRALIDMHALVFVPSPSDRPLPSRRRGRLPKSVLRIHHASLYDFLTDRSRSLEYYIDPSLGHANLSRSWLKLIATRPQSRHSQYTYLSLPITAFIYHYEKAPTKETADELARINLRVCLEGISNLDVDLYRPNWPHFFECVKQQGEDRRDVFPRLQNDFDAFILDSIALYPQPLRSYIPILLLEFRRGRSSADMFDVLLHAISKSAEELHKFRNIDERLLGVVAAVYDDYGKNYIVDLLRDKARAGKHFVDGKGYVALAKAIVSVLCPECWDSQIEFQKIGKEDDRYLDGSDPTRRIGLLDPNLPWFPEILKNASTDLDLAHRLRERAIQSIYNFRFVPGRETIAVASIKYIQRCGIPVLEPSLPLPFSWSAGDCLELLPKAGNTFDVGGPLISIPLLLSIITNDSYKSFESFPKAPAGGTMLTSAAPLTHSQSVPPGDGVEPSVPLLPAISGSNLLELLPESASDILPPFDLGVCHDGVRQSSNCLSAIPNDSDSSSSRHLLPDSEPSHSAAISDPDPAIATDSNSSSFGFEFITRRISFYLLISPSSYIDIFL